MRHRVTKKKMNRSVGQRRALTRNLLTELFRHERIRTTEAKARIMRPQAERLITIAKRAQAGRGDSLAARRRLASVLRDPDIVKKVYEEVAPRYTERNGGYTRILKLGQRLGDAASIVYLELVE